MFADAAAIEAHYETHRVEIDGHKFLVRTAGGKPYTVKRWVEGANGVWRTGRPHWSMAWAEWHKNPPKGRVLRAIEATCA